MKKGKAKHYFTVPFKIGVIERNSEISDEEAVKVVLKPVLGDNFYYSYYSEGDKIFYAGFPATTVLVGKALPVFYPAMLKEGCYYYKMGKNYFLFFRDRDNFYSKTSTTVPKNCVSVFDVKVDKVPSTLYLKWSMDKFTFPVFFLALLVFLSSLIFYFVKSGKKIALTPRVDVRVVFSKKPTCRLGEELEKLVKQVVSYEGGVDKVEYKNNTLSLVAVFPDLNRAKFFASDTNGNIVGNKVVVKEKLVCSWGKK